MRVVCVVTRADSEVSPPLYFGGLQGQLRGEIRHALYVLLCTKV